MEKPRTLTNVIDQILELIPKEDEYVSFKKHLKKVKENSFTLAPESSIGWNRVYELLMIWINFKMMGFEWEFRVLMVFTDFKGTLEEFKDIVNGK